jgi:prephenate dehydrogenase
MQSTLEWLSKHRSLLKNKIIFEQCSLKEWIYESAVVKDLDVRSMHVLFRPSQTPNLEDRKVGLFKEQVGLTTAETIGSITQAKIAWYKDAEEHDREMAVQQALLHRTLLILSKLLKNCSGSTYISKRVIELADRIRKGNKDLYQRIQQNKYLPEKLSQLKKDFEEFSLENLW